MIGGKLFRDIMKTLQLCSLWEKDSSRFRLFRARDLEGHEDNCYELISTWGLR
jgi:hypothetical protein